jgi:hypothetical protein
VKRASGSRNVPIEARVCLWILVRWQGIHVLTSEVISFFMFDQKYFLDTCLMVFLTPLCDRLCVISTMFLLHGETVSVRNLIPKFLC